VTTMNPVTRNLTSKKKYKVLLVDDHPIIRHGVAALIETEPDLEVCAEADSPHGALDAVEKHKPDVVLADLSFEGLSGIELIKDFKVRYPNLPVLILSMHDESFYAERVLRAGAMGYIMKQEASEQVVNALRRVLSGQIYLSQKMCTRLLNSVFDNKTTTPTSPIESLSDRELEVFELIGQGLATRQIAQKLHLSVKTIESHRAHVKSKLGLKTSTELVQAAIRWIEHNEGVASGNHAPTAVSQPQQPQ
jgi:DNA-binding NarL/FixJ family response regulator